MSAAPPLASVRLNRLPSLYRCERGWHWSPPPLPDFDLWAVAEGEGEMNLGGKTTALAPGVCFLLPPGSSPKARHNPARRLTVFYAHFDPLNGAGETVAPSPLRLLTGAPLALRDPALFFTMAKECERAANKGSGSEEYAALLLAALLFRLWEDAQEPPQSPGESRLREIAAAMEREPGREWSVAAQAGEAGLSPSQYTRRFTAAIGESPNAYLIRRRLSRAEYLLRETDMRLSQIADALGYRDLYYFSRQFKQHRGLAPSDWRRRAVSG